MPFELFMETVLTHSGEHGLFNLFGIGQPNTNHFFITELCRLGLVGFVVTTNFNNHLETALEKTGVAYRLPYREEDFGELTGEPGVSGC
ncbi:MAG: hypothetical protein JWQ84_3432 [Mucilaginibacter sp.]|nr:hypothetical protein [Mucilaginibacter sp.]